MRTQFVAVAVSDNRLGDDADRGGEEFVRAVSDFHDECQRVLYTAYEEPDDLPPGVEFVRKESGFDELAEKVVGQFVAYLRQESIRELALGLRQFHLGYQSDAFGAVVRALYERARSPAFRTGANGRLPIVLLAGETGTGKSVLARLLHHLSHRRDAPFRLVTASDLSNEQRLRVNVFGCADRIYTGVAATVGAVTGAGEGVMLLDDFHLLRPTENFRVFHHFFETGEYTVDGHSAALVAGCSVVVAVEAGPFDRLCANGDFPPALVDRMQQMRVDVPPLAARPEDVFGAVPGIVRSLCAEYGYDLTVDDEAVEWLAAQSWAGASVRVLRTVIAAARLDQGRRERVGQPEVERSYQKFVQPSPTSPPPPTTTPMVPTPRAPTPRTTPSTATTPKEEVVKLDKLAVDLIRKNCNATSDQAAEWWRELRRPDGALANILNAIDEVRKVVGSAPQLDTLLRIFAVIQTDGRVSAAAQRLGMKDSALRQYLSDKRQTLNHRGEADGDDTSERPA